MKRTAIIAGTMLLWRYIANHGCIANDENITIQIGDRQMMKQIRAYREYMNLALITAGISFSAFYVAKIDTLLYLPIAAAIWGILLVNYPVEKNRRFFRQAGMVLFVNLAVYTIVKFLQCGVVPLRMLHLAYIVYGLSLLKNLWDCRDNGQIGERDA